MKVLILSVSDKRHMSMVVSYEDYLKDRKIQYDIIRVNRYDTKSANVQTSDIGSIYEYPFFQSTSVSKVKKIGKFFKFKFFARKLIKKNAYDFIIVWNENTAVLFADLLLNSYKNRYCINVRDVFEVSSLKWVFKKVVKNAYFVTTPSLDKGDDEPYITLLNHDSRVFRHVVRKDSLKKKDERLRMTFMGLYNAAPETFKRTVDIFANDARFELYFYGDGFDTKLRKYCDRRKINNVVTGGAFPYEKTYEYLNNTDILNSYYNNFDTNQQNLLRVSGVKQSYTPMLYLPAINDDGTTWANISKKYGFSYLINDDNISTLPDDLYNWYHSLDFEVFKKGCDEFNKIVQKSRDAVFDLLDNQFS